MRKIGSALIFWGTICILAAILLAARNGYEGQTAGAASDRILAEIHAHTEKIRHRKAIAQAASYEAALNSLPDPYDPKMTEREIGGIRYVGYIAIPALHLELPIASEWSYDRLKLSPCRYSGSSKTDDLTIAAHSYKRHFGRIGALKLGDEVILTDMDDIVIRYEVVAKEVLAPDAMEDMKGGKYALTLFTCTYDSQNRITVRCDRKE